MMDKFNTIALPVHDSFIVKAGYEHDLESVMQECFRKVTGVAVGIKPKIKTGMKKPAVDFLKQMSIYKNYYERYHKCPAKN
jgi:hypothetical protein